METFSKLHVFIISSFSLYNINISHSHMPVSPCPSSVNFKLWHYYIPGVIHLEIILRWCAVERLIIQTNCRYRKIFNIWWLRLKTLSGGCIFYANFQNVSLWKESSKRVVRAKFDIYVCIQTVLGPVVQNNG